MSLAGDDRWRRILPVVLVLWVVVPLGCAVASAFDDGVGTPSTRAVGIAGSVVLAAVAVGSARRVHRCVAQGSRTVPLVAVAVEVALFVGLVLLSPYFFFVAPLVYWQMFSTIGLRIAIAVAAGFSAVMVALQLRWSGGDLGDNGAIVVGAFASLAGAVLFASWIGGIIEQSRERAVLIDELAATRAELAAVNHGAGVLAERERLAREIHDTLAQGFTSIVMLSQAASATDDPAEAARLLASIERTARENLADARDLVEGSGPTVLADGSLVGALERLAERAAADLGIAATAEVRGVPRALPSVTEVALLRAAQEAVANVRRHAGAHELRIVLDYAPVDAEPHDAGVAAPPATGSPSGPDAGAAAAGAPAAGGGARTALGGRAAVDEPVAAIGEALGRPVAVGRPAVASGPAAVTVEVHDDGCGFDVATAHLGYGLSGMRRRLEQVGGHVDVQSREGHGTLVRVAVP